jgi:tetratricopeptide (TPR) repeat protein
MKTSAQLLPLMQKAVAHHQVGQLAEAEQTYLKVLEGNAHHSDALRLLGSLYIQRNQFEQAVLYLEKAQAAKPQDAEAHNNLGVALYKLGKSDDAIACYQQAIKIKPDYRDALNNLGNIFYERGQSFHAQEKTSEAILNYEQALRYTPDNLDILTRLAELQRNAGKIEEACEFYKRIVGLRPDDVNLRVNFGTLLHDAARSEDAMEQYDHILRLQPNSLDALVSRGSLLMELDRIDEAKASYDEALRLAPISPDAKWGKALALLTLGNYREGWQLYESGFDRKNTRGIPPIADRFWDGSSQPGKRLLIWGEQGLGDVLQFIRYAALCRERVGRIIVQCREPLVRLLANCPYIDDVVTTATSADFDYHISVMSLPYIFGTTLETIPAEIPYLFVGEEARQKWAPRFADQTNFKVGLVWAGNPRKHAIDAHIVDRRRSMTLDLMRPLFAFDQIQFYNLQMGEPANQIDSCSLRDTIIDYMPEVADFMDTAAIIENLDLVISVDTSVVHLAGGLGKPVWILSRFDACWRWLRNREQSPWYPTARIFGQPKQGDWVAVVDAISKALNLEAQRKRKHA